MSTEDPQYSVDARRQRMLDMRSAHLQRRKERFASIAKDPYADAGLEPELEATKVQPTEYGYDSNVPQSYSQQDIQGNIENEPVAQYYTYNPILQSIVPGSQADTNAMHKRLMQLGADHESLASHPQPQLGLDTQDELPQPTTRRQAPPVPPTTHRQLSKMSELMTEGQLTNPPVGIALSQNGADQRYTTHPSPTDSPRSGSPTSGMHVVADDHRSTDTPPATAWQGGSEAGSVEGQLNASGAATDPAQRHVPAGLRVTPSGHLEDASGNVYFDMSDRVAFAMRPAPRRAMIQCTIVREKSLFKSVFHCYLQVDRAFLINAKKTLSSKTSHYEISVTQDDFDKMGAGYLGKLRGNFVGTEFTIYDAGYNPEKKTAADHADNSRYQAETKHSDHDSTRLSTAEVLASNDPVLPLPPQNQKLPAEGAIGTVTGGARAEARRELGTIVYDANFLANKGPRKMRVLIPRIMRNNVAAVWRPLKPTDSLLANYRATCTDSMFILENKVPRWNERVRAYVLNFGGRVTLPSVKNFQLVQSEDPETVVLQFGRTGKDTFTMDYSYPLTLLQAFGICLSSLDSKLACD